MKYKGYELIKDINDLAIGTIIKSEDGKIYILNQKEDGTRTFSRKDGTNRRFCCYTSLQKEYEILEDKTDEMEEIKELDEWVTRRNGEVTQSEAKIIEIGNKLNELVRAVNKLNKQDTSRETNCMSE